MLLVYNDKGGKFCVPTKRTAKIGLVALRIKLIEEEYYIINDKKWYKVIREAA